MVGAVLAELLSEVIDTETEITHGGFDVFSLLLLDDCVEGLTSALLFNALSPLFLDLRQMLLLL